MALDMNPFAVNMPQVTRLVLTICILTLSTFILLDLLKLWKAFSSDDIVARIEPGIETNHEEKMNPVYNLNPNNNVATHLKGVGYFKHSDNPAAEKKDSGVADSEAQEVSGRSTNDDGRRPMPTRASHVELKHRLPLVLLLGEMKCGTGAIKNFLSTHPTIVVKIREMNFFSSNYEKGLDWYLTRMPLSAEDQLTLEGSPSYSVSKEAPRRILAHVPQAKLMLALCNPVTRAISHFAHGLAHNFPHLKALGYPTFEEYAFYSNGSVHTERQEIMRSIYSAHLSQLLDIFPRTQFHIIDGDVLRTRPWEELMKVESFLELKHNLTQESFVLNTARGFYCHRTLGCLGEGKGRSHPLIAPERIQTLKEYYEKYNKQLFEMIGKSFDWE